VSPPLERDAWPDPVRAHAEHVAGLFVGGCVARGDGSSFRHMAHAHTDGAHVGWICVRAAWRLLDFQLMAHEVAHVLTGDGHTDRWRQCVLDLGGTLDGLGDYREMHKRTRTLKDRRRPHLGYEHHPRCPCRVP